LVRRCDYCNAAARAAICRFDDVHAAGAATRVNLTADGLWPLRPWHFAARAVPTRTRSPRWRCLPQLWAARVRAIPKMRCPPTAPCLRPAQQKISSLKFSLTARNCYGRNSDWISWRLSVLTGTDQCSSPTSCPAMRLEKSAARIWSTNSSR
jgi:hypothetical protein